MSSKTYYFVGIGGIGMSAIARYLKNNGHNIYGYDRTRTQLTAELEKEGMNITYEDDINHLPEVIDLAIYTPAIPAENKILKEIIKAIKKLFGFLEQCERNNAPVLICMDCGYYERI